MMPAERTATVAALREALTGLPAAVRALPPDRVDMAPMVAEWSAREVVAHLADAEQVYGVRLRLMLPRERPFLAAYDQDAWTRRFGRLETLAAALGRWIILRRANLAVLESLDEAEWRRPGDHEEGMKLRRVETPESVADELVRHTRQHLEQMPDAARGDW